MTLTQILRSHIGRCGVSYREVAVVVEKRRIPLTRKSREKRVRSWLEGRAQPSATELLALMRHLGEDFTNDCLQQAGYGAAIRLKGEIADYEARQHVVQFDQALHEYWRQPGNGNEHRVRRAAARALHRLRQFLHRPKMHRLRAT